MARIPRAFFARDSATVARDLLGCRLLRRHADGRLEAGRIVETEAYPPGDPSSHAFRGLTARCASMFARPATVYVYRIYGAYFCLNIATERVGVGAAILIRGLDGIDGCAGPGRLCRRLDITLALDGGDALAPSAPIRILGQAATPSEPIVTSTRIGLSKAADLPLRYYLLGSTGVSRRDRAAEQALARSGLEPGTPNM
jgi:DNA-3-methyladenine glycosylase